MFNKSGIGSERYDNGILLLVAPEEGKICNRSWFWPKRAIERESLSGPSLDKYLALFSDNEFDYGTLEVIKTLVVKVNDYYDFPESATIPHYDL